MENNIEFNISATDSAVKKIGEILEDENSENAKLRICVEGGGCAGFNYKFMLDDDLSDDDFACDLGSNVQLIVDGFSAQYLDGASIDYVEGLMENKFVINNPNAKTSCGCGSSFNPY